MNAPKAHVEPEPASRKHATVQVGEPFRPYQRFRGCVVPEALCRYAGIGAGEKLCWGRLARYQGKTGDAYPSMRVLGAELGVSERQARLYVAELERQGFIRRVVTIGTTNRFQFLWHAIFDEPRKNSSAPPRKDSSAPPRKDVSEVGGKNLPPKRIIEESRRQENHVEESQLFKEGKTEENDDDAQRKAFASETDELIALIRDSTGVQPDAKLVRQIREFLELRRGTLREFLDDVRPRLKRLKSAPTSAFFHSQARNWGGEGSRPAPEPRMGDGGQPRKCSCSYGQILTPEGISEPCPNCGTGRDLARVNARKAREQTSARNTETLKPCSV